MVSGPLTWGELLRQGRATLEAAPGHDENYPHEAAYLLEKVTGFNRGQLLQHGGELASPALVEQYFALLARRAAHEPLQYLLGEWEFYGLPFAVGPGVLIPRPETEDLVEQALAFLRPLQSPRVLDLCSGSGCIPIAIGHSRPDATIYGVELSPVAYAYFLKNLALNHTKNVTPFQSDVFALSETITSGRYHALTSNPPYITTAQMEGLQDEVRREPSMALDGGADGLDFYRALPGLACTLLEPGGLLALEIGNEQGEAVAGLVAAAGFTRVAVHRDLSGQNRVVTGIY